MRKSDKEGWVRGLNGWVREKGDKEGWARGSSGWIRDEGLRAVVVMVGVGKPRERPSRQWRKRQGGNSDKMVTKHILILL